MDLKTFRNCRAFAVPVGWVPTPNPLQSMPFTPTEPTQALSRGFVPPRSKDPGDYPLSEVVSGIHVVRLRTQSRTVPKSAIDREVDAIKDKIEKETGRKPGRKETKALREEAALTLLPRAFPRDHDLFALIDPIRGVMVVNTASTSKASDVATALITAHTTRPTDPLEPPLVIAPVATADTPVAFMLRILSDQVPRFNALGKCSLCAEDELARQVVYTNHSLAGNDEIAQHVKTGELPVFVEMAFEQHTTFTLTSDFAVRGITMHNDLTSGSTAPGNDRADDAFDANVAILSDCIFKLYDALIDAMGRAEPDRQVRIDTSLGP